MIRILIIKNDTTTTTTYVDNNLKDDNDSRNNNRNCDGNDHDQHCNIRIQNKEARKQEKKKLCRMPPTSPFVRVVPEGDDRQTKRHRLRSQFSVCSLMSLMSTKSEYKITFWQMLCVGQYNTCLHRKETKKMG